VQTVGRAGPVDAAELLERTEQLCAPDDSLAGVSEGARGRLVLLPGEAGIGKTALLRRFRENLGPGVRVLWAACDPVSVLDPYFYS
jgi:ATP/maltotriose-dependent transcriptional regulator MalT